MTDATAHPDRPIFPCPAVPAEGRAARLLGLYDQRQEGLLMQRIKILGGRLDLAQWRRVAELAARLTPGVPLRLTTRQDIEYHGLRPGDVPALQTGLDEVGLTTVGACGDTIRAVTISPENGLAPGAFDLAPLAAAIHAHAQSLPDAFRLPRKFKISLTGAGEESARPFINDIGLVANTDGTFRAAMAGSLGARPATGIVCYEALPLADVLPLITAALRLFAAEGDRQNRSRARLRHVRERLGDVVFRQCLDNLFREEKQQPYPAPPALPRAAGSPRPALRLSVPRGELTTGQVLELVETLTARSAVMRIGFAHDLYLYGIEKSDLPAPFQAWVDAPRVIACPGAHFCSRGITETFGAADQLRDALAGSGLLAAISGCPNNCSHAAVADVGLIGRLKTIAGEQRPHYRLFAGGGHGNAPELAIELHPAVPLEKITAAAAWLIDQWRSSSPSRSFGEFVRTEKDRLANGISELSLAREEPVS